MLQVACSRVQEAWVIAVHGELVLETVDQFQAAAAGLPEGVCSIRVDCRDLTFFDSTGANALFQAVLRWKAAGIAVKLEHLQEYLREMLELLGFFSAIAGQP